MSKKTTAKVARLAARFLSGELQTLTRKQQLSVCASCVSQAEREQESVKAWGTEIDGKPLPWATKLREDADYSIDRDSPGKRERVIRVEIRRVRPARADKRTQARKRK